MLESLFTLQSGPGEHLAVIPVLVGPLQALIAILPGLLVALGGALVMAAFALGGVPGLSAVQLGTAWPGRRPRLERILRIGIPLVAAAALVYRTVDGGDPSAATGAMGAHHNHPMP